MNNSIGRIIEVKLDFLTAGNYTIEMWADTGKSDKEPMDIKKSAKSIKSGETIKITLAKNGGFVAVIKSK
jgi:alpha-glucosidase